MTSSSLKGQDYDTVTVTIANGASLSDAAEVAAGAVVALDLPTLTNAALSFQVSVDGATFRDLYNSDGTTETSVGATTGARVVAAPAALAGAAGGYVKVRSGLTGAAVNQGAERSIKLFLRRV